MLGPHRPLYVRTHRWQKCFAMRTSWRAHPADDPMPHVLFSTDAGRHGALRQADGPQRADLDDGGPAGPRRSAPRSPSRSTSREALCRRAARSAIASSSRPCASGRRKSTGIVRWPRSPARNSTSLPATRRCSVGTDRLPDRLPRRQAGPALARSSLWPRFLDRPGASRRHRAIPPRDQPTARAHDDATSQAHC